MNIVILYFDCIKLSLYLFVISSFQVQAELTFDNDSDFASFLTSTDSSSSGVFNDVWFSLAKSIVNSQWYIKKSALI